MDNQGQTILFVIEFFFQILLDILGNAMQFEPDALLIELVKFL